MGVKNQFGGRWSRQPVVRLARLALVLGVLVNTLSAQHWLEGRVVDARRRPIASVEIHMQSSAWNSYNPRSPAPGSKPVARTDAQGDYRVENRQAIWHFSKPGFATTVVRNPQGMVVMIPGREVVGKVKDEAGKALAGVQMVCFLQYEDPHAQHGTPLVKTTTQEDGSFVLRGVPLEGVTLEARKDGYYDHRYALVSNAPIELRLEASGFVRGQIVSAQGQALKGWIWVLSELERRNAWGHTEKHWSNADGHFSVPLRYRGRCRLRVNASGHHMRESHVLDGPEDLGRFSLMPAKRLSVRVVDGEGQPLRTAFVGRAFVVRADLCLAWRWENDILATQRVVDQKGWAHLRLDPDPSKGNRWPSVGRVGVWARGYGYRRIDVTLDPTGEVPAPLTIKLSPQLTLEGVVVDEAGKPVAGVQVDHAFAQHFDGGRDWAGKMHAGRRSAPRIPRTDATGRFRIPGLSAGRYMLVATHRFRPVGDPMSVTIGPGQGKDRGVDKDGASIELLSPSGASVHGRLLGVLMSGCIRVGGAPEYLNDDRHPLVVLHKGGGFVSMGLTRKRGSGPKAEWFSHKVQLLLSRPPPSRMIPLVLGEVECKKPTNHKVLRLNSLGLSGMRGFVRQDMVPSHRLLIRLIRISGGWNRYQYSSVALDGSFRIEAAPGKFALHVLDWVTGVQLHSDRSIELEADQVLRHDIKINTRVVDVQLGPARPGMRVSSVNLTGRGGGLHRNLHWGKKLRLYLPDVSYKLSASLHSITVVRIKGPPMPPGLYEQLKQPLGTVLIPKGLGNRPGIVPLVTLPVQAPQAIPD